MGNNQYLLMINSNWTEVVSLVNSNSMVVLKLYKQLKRRFLRSNFDVETLRLSLCLLENNNILFHHDANYKYYQDISCELFKKLNPISKFGNKELFYRFCFAGVYTDYFNNKPIEKKLYEKFLLSGLRYFRVKYKKTNSREMLSSYLLGLIHVSQHYLFKGDIKNNSLCLKKSGAIVRTCNWLNSNYRAFFYYHYAWSFYERHRNKKALEFINKLLVSKGGRGVEPIALHAMNVKCAMLYALRRYKACLDLANRVYLEAKKVFSANNQDVYAESLLNIAKCLNKQGVFLYKAKEHAQKAISILTTLFLGDNIDISQALANIVLGEVYEKMNNTSKALGHYTFSQKIYENIYKNNVTKNARYLQLKKKIQQMGS